MAFDYERETRTRYQSDDVASRYHRNYTQDYGLRGIRSRIIASAERRTVSEMLASVPHKAVLDVPTGTGKLAPVFAKFKSSVWACDVSPNMLDVARSEFERFGCDSVQFSVEDASDLGNFEPNQFDAVVCLRLVHRVPSEIRKKILARMSELAPYTIVSFSIDNSYNKVRRTIRNSIIGGGKSGFCCCTIDEAREEIEAHFNIKKKSWIIPLVSEEMVFLLESRNCPPSST